MRYISSARTGLSVNYSNCRTRGIPLAASATIRKRDCARFRLLALRVYTLTRMSREHATNERASERTRYALFLRLASRSSRSCSRQAPEVHLVLRRSSRVLRSREPIFRVCARLYSHVLRDRLIIFRRSVIRRDRRNRGS